MTKNQNNTMSTEVKKDFLKDILKYEMSSKIQCLMANEYADYTIYVNDEDGLEDMLSSTDKSEIVRAIFYGEYSYYDKFVRFSDYRNIESVEDVWDWIDIDKFVEWLINGEDADLKDAYMILKEDDVADVLCNFQWCFADVFDYEHDDVSEWVYDHNIGVVQICREDWNDLIDDFLSWKEQKEVEYQKTIKRCED